MPVVGDREDVVPGAPVVARERPGRQLAVRVGRVRVQRGPQPVSVPLPGRVHRESLLQWRRRARTIAGHGTRTEEGPWRISRSRSTSSSGGSTRSGSTGASCSSGALPPRCGLTVISLPEAALAARAKALADPPIRGPSRTCPQLVAAAKKEGHLNVIALPPDWANYGEIISTFTKKYGIGITSDNPNGSSSEENQAIVSLKGDPRAPDVVDVSPTFAVAGTVAGLYARYYVSNYADRPAGDEGHARLLDGRLLRLGHDRLQREPRARRRRSRSPTC